MPVRLTEGHKQDLIKRIDKSLNETGLNPKVTCPADPKWLSAMAMIFPKDVFCNNKPGKYSECLEKNPCE